MNREAVVAAAEDEAAETVAPTITTIEVVVAEEEAASSAAGVEDEAVSNSVPLNSPPRMPPLLTSPSKILAVVAEEVSVEGAVAVVESSKDNSKEALLPSPPKTRRSLPPPHAHSHIQIIFISTEFHFLIYYLSRSSLSLSRIVL